MSPLDRTNEPPRTTEPARTTELIPSNGLCGDGLWRTRALVRHNLTLVAREPAPMIGRIVMPVVLVLVLSPLYTSALGGPQRGTAQAVIGMLVTFSLLGMSVVGNSVLSERSWHTLDRLRASPARPVELLAGKAIPVLGLVVLQQAVLLGLGVAVLHLRVASYGLLALAVASWAFALLSAGSAVAMLVRSQAELAAAVDIGAMVLTSLAGALVPLAAMPGWARAIAPVSPGYWAIRALTGALAGDPRGTLSSAAVLAGMGVLAAGVAGLRLATGWGRSQLL
jgi:ABC-2 type transport system permease protein